MGGLPGLAGALGWFGGEVACCVPGCVVAGLRSPWICGSGGAEAFLGSSFGSAGLVAVFAVAPAAAPVVGPVVRPVRAVICGPGSIDQAHKPDEFVAISELEACGKFIDRLIDAWAA